MTLPLPALSEWRACFRTFALMFVPLLVLVGLLSVALAVLLGRRARLRHAAGQTGARLAEVEARVAAAQAAARRVADGLDGSPSEATAERRPGRRRVRRVATPATPDRP